MNKNLKHCNDLYWIDQVLVFFKLCVHFMIGWYLTQHSLSRCVDELENQLSKHGSLKKLYFYHQHLTAVSSCSLLLSPFPLLLTVVLLCTIPSLKKASALNIVLFMDRSSETLCLAQKDALSIVVHGLVLLVVFLSVHPPLFQKRWFMNLKLLAFSSLLVAISTFPLLTHLHA